MKKPSKTVVILSLLGLVAGVLVGKSVYDAWAADKAARERIGTPFGGLENKVESYLPSP